jgi:hypothetical protein
LNGADAQQIVTEFLTTYLAKYTPETVDNNGEDLY